MNRDLFIIDSDSNDETVLLDQQSTSDNDIMIGGSHIEEGSGTEDTLREIRKKYQGSIADAFHMIVEFRIFKLLKSIHHY